MRISSMRAVLAAGVVLAASIGVEARAESLTLVTFSGYYPPTLFEDFKKETGIDVNLVETSGNEETMAKMVASGGTGFDLLVVSHPFVEALNKLGMLSEIDHSKLPNLANLYEEASKLSYDPGLQFSVPWAWDTFGLCYRSDLVSKAPTSWGDVLNPSDDLKGKYTMVSDERWFLEPAQLYSGLSINDVSEEALEKIRPLLVNAKKNVLTFDSFTMHTRLISGEINMAAAWDNWCNLAIRENPNVKYVIPKEGTDTVLDVYVMPKKAENKEAAEKFLNFILKPEVQGGLITELLYKVPNRAAMEAHKDIVEKYSPLQIPASDLLKYPMLKDLGADAPRVSKFITEVMSSE
ncbi:spermidine/putrescine ABC transporter substrate-binding protein [Rhizobium sp. NZLR11]|uniref:polyamine ABC transporter substrate-binding protein n=1 Tax=Rhizobium sp. NZLR11 TaxID=2731098 RepID=UPI001C834909|nr:spermidine/putrescine ABC transporter substrate-binding protein [Rhizobium sp. NZLR11]MBX5210532.1 spermidine/putrescine ABC transporter substrate-binding protein [Rhizobium sp. NZLR11]